MTLRPRLRISITAALIIVGAAYVGRSVLVRNGDFRLDVTDVIVLALTLSAIGVVAWLRATGRMTEDESTCDSSSDGDQCDRSAP